MGGLLEDIVDVYDDCLTAGYVILHIYSLWEGLLEDIVDVYDDCLTAGYVILHIYSLWEDYWRTLLMYMMIV